MLTEEKAIFWAEHRKRYRDSASYRAGFLAGRYARPLPPKPIDDGAPRLELARLSTAFECSHAVRARADHQWSCQDCGETFNE
jgi:hypothetical protein